MTAHPDASTIAISVSAGVIFILAFSMIIRLIPKRVRQDIEAVQTGNTIHMRRGNGGHHTSRHAAQNSNWAATSGGFSGGGGDICGGGGGGGGGGC